MAQKVRHKFSPRTDLVEGRTDFYKFFFDLCVPAIECSQPSPNTAQMSKLSKKKKKSPLATVFCSCLSGITERWLLWWPILNIHLGVSRVSQTVIWREKDLSEFEWPNGLGYGPQKGKEPVEWTHSRVSAYWCIRMWTSSLDFSPRGCPQPSIWPWNLPAMKSTSPQNESKSVPFSLLAFVRYLAVSKIIETGLFLFTAVMSSPPWQMMLQHVASYLHNTKKLYKDTWSKPSSIKKTL